MIIIKLTQSAYVEGYDGAFYRYTTEDGQASACGIYDNWYTARAIDDDGKEYRVIWQISDLDAFNRGDEDCCDWDNPAEVIDLDSGLPVNAKIAW